MNKISRRPRGLFPSLPYNGPIRPIHNPQILAASATVRLSSFGPFPATPPPGIPKIPRCETVSRFNPPAINQIQSGAKRFTETQKLWNCGWHATGME